MTISWETRKMPRPLIAWGAALALAACLLAPVLFFSAAEAPPPSLLAEKDGISVRRGAPEWNGRSAVISRRQLLQGALLLVSPEHPLPRDFPVPDTRAIRAMVGSYLPVQEGVMLREEAIYALCSAQTERDLSPGAIFILGAVSAAQQEELRREAYQRYSLIYPIQEAVDRASAAVPGGGESEHQTGFAIDLSLTGPLSMAQGNPLRRNETGRWIDENIWRFGFIQRYAPGHSDEGQCESVHLRYVGPVHAAAMHALDLTLEDYLALLRREGRLTVYRDGRLWACLYCQPCEGDWSLALPETASCQFSADNTGWAVAAVEER